MGQKVNPVGFRVLKNKKWNSVWFDKKNYANNLINDIKIADFIEKNYSHCHIDRNKIIIERTSDKLSLVISTSRPGVIIGKKGSDIEKISKEVKKIAGMEVDVKITEIDKPDINASLVAQNIARQIENRANFKKAIKRSIQSAMKHSISGIKVQCSGRLSGVEIARSESYKDGSIPLHTLRSDIDYAIANAYTTYGIIGIKVWINKG
jgi:small subunit ribosomal protein S3